MGTLPGNMPGRQHLTQQPYGQNVRRREVLLETIERLQHLEHFHQLAAANMERWSAAATPAGAPVMRVLPGDWGDVTLAVTKEFGHTFAVLNMANAYCPGGGYLEGMVAQEENMYRRTNCHFQITDEEMTPDEYYKPECTALINGENGRVYLDPSARVCIRGVEDRSQADLGYSWLADEDIYPFYELRSAADDHRDGSPYDSDSMRKKIRAQLDTAIDQKVRHIVLSAFGCGAFGNPADDVARIYKEELEARHGSFDCVAFGIFDAGYGPDNFSPFAAAFPSCL